MSIIALTDVEQQIFDILLSISDKYALGITFRVAGGWVRDKLLGNQSDDIDISLDVMTGKQFCKFLKRKINVNIHIIEENHDQCKHLEVASITLFDINIDFLHLRNEEYYVSRIPQIRIGTPREDALRRDLTINSLFYNINTCTIEDYTEKGLDDLRNKIIRTPLDTETTFTDDPLRILRAIRFYVTLPYFSMDNDVISTVRDKSNLRRLIKEKVSSERIIIEIRKIIKINAVMGIHVMNQMNIVKDLLNISINEHLMKIITNYGEKNGDTMDIITFVSLLYYDNNYVDLLNLLKITNKEKKDATCVIISLINHINLLKSGVSTAKLGRIIFDIGKDALLDISVNILRSIVPDSEFNTYNTEINKLRWVIGMKPIVNGNEIIKLFNVKGYYVKTLLDKVINMQIINKNYTKDLIIEQLVAEKS